MAGPYVHCLVLRESLKNVFNDPTFSRYQSITNPDEGAQYFQYVCLGSVSPDFPYPALAVGINSKRDTSGWTWGDKFHKQNTGNFIDIGIQQLQGINDKGSDLFLKKAAWLMGYYSHVITDLIIHAVVYDLVGGCYENHSHDHLHCEVVEDSLLFYDVYSEPPQELIDRGFLKSILDKCQVAGPDVTTPTPLPTYVFDTDIETFWDSILRQDYSDFYTAETPNIDDWYSTYKALVIDATKVVARIIEPGMAYHKTTDIAADEKTRYYSDVSLPDGTKGNYKDKVFNKAVAEVTRRLKNFLGALDSMDLYLDLKKDLRNWNLDKGTIDDHSPQFALWNGETEFPFDCNGDPPLTS